MGQRVPFASVRALRRTPAGGRRGGHRVGTALRDRGWRSACRGAAPGIGGPQRDQPVRESPGARSPRCRPWSAM